MARVFSKSSSADARQTEFRPQQGERPNYVPPGPQLKKLVQRQRQDGGGETVTLPLAVYFKLLEMSLKPIFDETAYLARFPDVAKAVKSGIIPSGLRHYVTNGHAEGRAPISCDVDDLWYRQTYPDVAEAIGKGKVRDSRHHFEDFGYFEGRVPNKSYLGPVAEWRDMERTQASSKPLIRR